MISKKTRVAIKQALGNSFQSEIDTTTTADRFWKKRSYARGSSLKNWSIRGTIFTSLLTAMAFSGHAIKAEETSSLKPCKKEKACRIEYDHLATQETDPFLFSGQQMDEAHPRWHQYRRALGHFSDVRDCLVKAERDKPEPNLLLIDWSRVGMAQKFEVCLFRIGRSVGSEGQIRAWLNYHKFRLSNGRLLHSEAYRPSFQGDPVYQVEAGWSKDYEVEVVGKPWLDLLPKASNTVVVRFNEKMEVVGVHAATTTK